MILIIAVALFCGLAFAAGINRHALELWLRSLLPFDFEAELKRLEAEAAMVEHKVKYDVTKLANNTVTDVETAAGNAAADVKGLI